MNGLKGKKMKNIFILFFVVFCLSACGKDKTDATNAVDSSVAGDVSNDGAACNPCDDVTVVSGSEDVSSVVSNSADASASAGN